MISIGIDIGSVCAKGAVYDGAHIRKCILPTGWHVKNTAEEIYKKLLTDYDIREDQVSAVVATGYGRIAVPFATKKVTEITCHARGAVYLNPESRTIIDIGGQDSKAISVDHNGNVLEFIMNDKCAAGTGRFLQVMANVLETEVDQLETLASIAAPREINSMCAVFAESEVISLLAQGVSKEAVSAGILHSISVKIMHIANRIAIQEVVMFTGGVSGNSYIKRLLSEKLKKQVVAHGDSQYAGAIGAAIIGFGK